MQCDSILVIKGTSQYDQLRCECDEMIRGFIEQGRIVTVLDLLYEGDKRQKKGWTKEYDMIFSFNAIGAELYAADENAKKPLFWDFQVDHPVDQQLRFADIYQKLMISCIDGSHVRYIDDYWQEVAWTCFMPHGGITKMIRQKDYHERKYDVVFLGSLPDEKDILADMAEVNSAFPQAYESICRIYSRDWAARLEDVMDQMLIELGKQTQKKADRDLMVLMLPFDSYRRYNKRKKLIEELCRNGIKVEVWGTGWESMAEKWKDVFHYNGNVSYEETAEIMGDSRIVLNDMPPYYEGSHERVFAAMQCGALCVTDRSTFLEDCFTDKDELCFYDKNKLDELCVMLRELLADPAGSEEIAQRGHLAAKMHTWKDRAADIIDIVENL